MIYYIRYLIYLNKNQISNLLIKISHMLYEISYMSIKIAYMLY